MKKIFILAIILLSGTAAASAQEFLTINPDVRTSPAYTLWATAWQTMHSLPILLR